MSSFRVIFYRPAGASVGVLLPDHGLEPVLAAWLWPGSKNRLQAMARQQGTAPGYGQATRIGSRLWSGSKNRLQAMASNYQEISLNVL
eukprot:364689-Chlamydomonas_euryale.AAC.2